ncbi:MAG: SNF2-related protein [Candidatus Polarisedimenticolaceae bacterium]|nr:SNF2-related protein [Candidatus Polarisedimenticolaceae bacterium]
MKQKQLPLASIRENFSESYYARGKSYFKQGMILSVEIVSESDDEVTLTAMSRGSFHDHYTQRIDIQWLDDDDVDITGHCSCPMRINCKHVVAACLHYQAEFAPTIAKKPSGSTCMNWLEEFISSESEPTHPAEKEFILYLLKPLGQPGQVTVNLLLTRHLKRGGLSKGRLIRLDQISDSYYLPDYAQEIDQEITSLLSACPQAGWHAPRLIEDTIGFTALSKMVESGRCHWANSANPPLQYSDERPLHIEWQQDEAGDAHLSCSVVGGGVVILTSPLLYVDKTAHIIGPLSGANFNKKQMKKLLRPITIPASHLNQFSQQLVTALPHRLPPPVEVKVTEVKGEKPTPRLLLSAIDGAENSFHRIYLDFLYMEQPIDALPAYEIESFNRDGELIQIWRDLAKEQAAIERIEQLGFTGMINENGRGIFFINTSQGGTLEDIDSWQDFLVNQLPILQDEGWQIERDEQFKMVFHESDHWSANIDGDNDWFNLRFDIEINGEKRPLLPLITSVLKQFDRDNLPEVLHLPLKSNEYLSLPSKQLKPMLDILYELYDGNSLDEHGALQMSRFDAGRLGELELQNSEMVWLGGESLRALGKKLNDFDGIQQITPPEGLKASLRHYQQQGLNWLQFLREYQFAGILADDMGLGKTVQTLAHLLYEKEQGRLTQPCLIIAPTSLMSNWRREAAQFTPELKVLILQGSDRRQHFDKIEQHDLILSTYPLLVRDEEILMQHHFHYLVLDEAQVVKNPKAKAAKMIRQINCNHRLCLTGTPMENHLGELWALFDFLMPGFLGDSKQFNTLFRTPIEKHRNLGQQQRLRKRVAPFMLRRKKDEVASELPAKTEIIRSVTLGSQQAALYESIRIAMDKKVRKAIASKGLARSHIMILDALLKLRQCCCDPQLLKLAQAQTVQESAKLELLMTLLPEMVEEGRCILLFSQFTQMLGIIEAQLNQHKISYSKLTGQTRKRDEAIERFKSGEADVFLISLKAGGVGLNLTEADIVIHYDPWWNPAAENQATDRAHRIGQDKAVFVYKLITENTLEEKILEMQARKHALTQGIYQKGSSTDEAALSSNDLRDLFAPLQ